MFPGQPESAQSSIAGLDRDSGAALLGCKCRQDACTTTCQLKTDGAPVSAHAVIAPDGHVDAVRRPDRVLTLGSLFGHGTP